MARKKRHSRALSLNVELVILAADANFEIVTQTGFNYRQKNVYPFLEKKGFMIQRCQESLARRMYVAPESRKTGVVYITGVGHGAYDSYTGDFYDPIFSVGNYSPEESHGKIVHLISCETARDLGPDFVLHGCRAYFGYDENFTFQLDDADIFFECDSEIDRGFAEGLTAGEVYDRARAVFDKYIAAFRAQGKEFKAATLEFDRDHLRAPSSGPQWGDVNARLV
ncbi:MAG TPA: hypothetical protein VGX92_01140 [Pyrinomonadaceae bacterium]|jgi:hypothetical protein|nr:hypothetical protein [Pyrinomonadaceae bacterium]